SYVERYSKSMEGGHPRSGDGTLLCPAQLSSAPHPLAANSLIGINSMEFSLGRLITPAEEHALPERSKLFTSHWSNQALTSQIELRQALQEVEDVNPPTSHPGVPGYAWV